MTGALVIFLVMGAALVAYAVTAGADFGGGVWDLFASGARKQAQRKAIEDAIAPIWEANHVWLIFIIVLMFTVFPRAFAAISIALHIPIAVALVGIVLRGAAFTFRAYGLEPPHRQRRWGHVFGVSSVLTPVALGMTLAAMSTGAIEVRIDPYTQVTSGYFAGWLTPFALLTGLFALTLFALLAAVYLSADTDGELAEDFRKRGLAMEGLAALVAALVFWRARVDAPLLFDNLAASSFTWPIQGATALAAATTIFSLWRRRYRLARIAVAAQVALVVIGWGLAMDGHLLLGTLPVPLGGARTETLAPLLPALAIGGLLLAPSLWYLFRVFKSKGAPV